VVANILGGVENVESQAIQELSLGEEATHRLQPPACLCLQILGNIVQLRNLFRRKS